MRTRFLLLFLTLTISLHAQKITGDWYGTIPVAGNLDVIFHISGSDDGLSGTFDVPKQNAFGLGLEEVKFEDNQFSCTIPTITGAFSGTLSEGRISGNFTQPGFSVPLVLNRTPPPPKARIAREQEPTDFPYERETVSFPGGAEAVTLAGELTYPTDGEIERVVVLVSGSGGQNRNSELGGNINHLPFLVLSDYLTRAGIAVLRYDDRGIGESTGTFAGTTSAGFADDANAAVLFLQQNEKTKSARIGIVGHSEGGLIAPMVASKNEKVDFLVLLAAPGVSIDALMLDQSRLVQQSVGSPTKLIEYNLKVSRAAYTMIRENPDASTEELTEMLVTLFKTSIAEMPEAARNTIQDPDAFARQQVSSLVEPWFRYFISFNPDVYLKQVEVPVIALNGALDMQVPASANLEAISRNITSNGNTDVTTVNLPNLNHLFQTAVTGAPSEYGSIEETFSPLAMQIIADWINER